MMTKAEAQAAIAKYGSQTKAAAGLGVSRSMLRRRLAGGGDNASEPAATEQTRETTGGIVLGSLNIYTQRPQNRVKGLIHKLKRGRGYPARELSIAWGIGEETIQNHAKRMHCWRYVEVTPGEYVGCVLHPDTAAKTEG